MRKFRWLLNWSILNGVTHHGDEINVRDGGKYIGKCKISIEGNKIIGDFNLIEDLNSEEYVLYTFYTLPDNLGNVTLESITLVDYYNGLETKARKVSEMDTI